MKWSHLPDRMRLDFGKAIEVGVIDEDGQSLKPAKAAAIPIAQRVL